MVRRRFFSAVSDDAWSDIRAPVGRGASFETTASRSPQDEDLVYARTAASPSGGGAKPALEA